MKSNVHQAQKGFTLLELLLVLAVLAIIAIAAFIIYPSVQAGQQANTESNNVTTMLANVRTVMSNGDYSDLDPGDPDNEALIRAIAPSSMHRDPFEADDLRTAWGQSASIQVDGTDDSRFNIVYEAVPAAACLKFVPSIAPTAQVIEVGGVEVINKDTDPTAGVNAALLAAECDSTPPADITIEFL